MKVRNKLSRRAQVISAIAVAIFFGGGWLVLWKWPHIKLRFAIARATPAMRTAMALRAEWMVIPDVPPRDWTRLDLGIVSISVPAPIEKIEAKSDEAVYINTSELEICIPNYFMGRDICDDFKNRRQLQLLGPDGRWRDAGYTSYAHAAGLASSADFRWNLSLDQVLALQQLLHFKAMTNDGVTSVFEGQDSNGVISWVSPSVNISVGKFGFAAICVMAKDERDGVVIWCRPGVKDGERLFAPLISSIRFPDKRYSGTAEDLARHIDTLVRNWASTTQPAQP